MQQNITILVQSPLMTLCQETRKRGGLILHCCPVWAQEHCRIYNAPEPTRGNNNKMSQFTMMFFKTQHSNTDWFCMYRYNAWTTGVKNEFACGKLLKSTQKVKKQESKKNSCTIK